MLLNNLIPSNNKQFINAVDISDILAAMYFNQTIPGYTKTWEKTSAGGNIEYDEIEYIRYIDQTPYIGKKGIYQYFYTATSDDLVSIDNGNIIITARYVTDCYDSTIVYKDESNYKFYSVRIVPYYIYRKYGTITVGDKIPVGSQGNFFIQRCV